MLHAAFRVVVEVLVVVDVDVVDVELPHLPVMWWHKYGQKF